MYIELWLSLMQATLQGLVIIMLFPVVYQAPFSVAVWFKFYQLELLSKYLVL